MKVTQHYFLDNQDTLRSISAFFTGVVVNVNALPGTMERVDNVTHQLTCRLDRKLLMLTNHVRHNFVWAACRDNFHSFAQLLALLGQLPQQAAPRLTADSITKPHVYLPSPS